MRSWLYHNPVAVQFGAGSLAALPGFVGDRRAVLVAFPEAVQVGITDRVGALLGSQLRGRITQTGSNPDVREMRALYEQFWHAYPDCDVIVAIGGGSALDTAKLLSVRMPSGDFAELHASLLEGRAPAFDEVKPCIAVPTTAGTGSEVTPYATLWDAWATPPRKLSLQSQHIFPEQAVIDPELALSLPEEPTLHSGLDALSHSLEAIWNVNANPIADALAVKAARSVLAVLPDLVRSLGDLSLRSRMSEAALSAGLAFSSTRTALAHSISYEMTMRRGLPHGLACSFTLPMVLGMAVGRDPERDRVLSKVFDGSLVGAQERLRAFLEGLGVATDFASYGVPPDEEADLVRNAQTGTRGRNFVRVPNP